MYSMRVVVFWNLSGLKNSIGQQKPCKAIKSFCLNVKGLQTISKAKAHIAVKKKIRT